MEHLKVLYLRIVDKHKLLQSEVHQEKLLSYHV